MSSFNTAGFFTIFSGRHTSNAPEGGTEMIRVPITDGAGDIIDGFISHREHHAGVAHTGFDEPVTGMDTHKFFKEASKVNAAAAGDTGEYIHIERFSQILFSIPDSASDSGRDEGMMFFVLGVAREQEKELICQSGSIDAIIFRFIAQEMQNPEEEFFIQCAIFRFDMNFRDIQELKVAHAFGNKTVAESDPDFLPPVAVSSFIAMIFIKMKNINITGIKGIGNTGGGNFSSTFEHHFDSADSRAFTFENHIALPFRQTGGIDTEQDGAFRAGAGQIHFQVSAMSDNTL